MEKRSRIIRKILLFVAGIAVTLIILLLIWAVPYARKLKNLAKEAAMFVAESTEATFSEGQGSVVYDAGGNVLFSYSGEKDLEYVKIDMVPQILIDAFVVMEDQDFYEHRGVDYTAVIRAIIENYKADTIVQGASTITQQLARNIFLTQDVNYSRKIEEIFIAYNLEQKYEKDQIMEFYLNNIYFGNGFYGIGAAAEGYFGKEVSELTIGECILLSAVPNNPSRYELFSNMDEAVGRARRIVIRLYEEHKISELDYMLLVAEGDASGEVSSGVTGKSANAFLTDSQIKRMESLEDAKMSAAEGYVYTYVTNCIIRYLMHANGFEFQYNIRDTAEQEEYDSNYDFWYTTCQQWLYTGGYSIYTAIDMNAQEYLLKVMDEKLQTLDKEDGTLMQGGAMCIDNETGFVVAAVGGRTEGSEPYGFNRAYQSYRQPGSSIKPLNVYTPYLCMGRSPMEEVMDVYDPQGPRNAGGAYAGVITLTDAVAYSKNTIAWKIYKEITPQSGVDYLVSLGFKKVDMDRNLLAGALGGFTYGVSVEEMAGGFAAIAADGVYRVPTCIKALHGKNGENIGGYEESVVYSVQASRLMTSMLKNVIDIGTGKRASLTNQACAGKTGTTNDNKDAWFVGYTPYYTTSVWAGYDIPQEISLVNGNVSCDIWREFMEYMHQSLPMKMFPSPEPVTETTGTLEEVVTDEVTTEEFNLENWSEEYEELTLPEEEELTLPAEEVLTLPPEEEELTLPKEEELTLPAEEELTLPAGEELTLPAEEELTLPAEEELTLPAKEELMLPALSF